MADAPTIGSVLAAVVPVMVGGLLAIAGGAGTQWYLQGLKTEEERRTKRAAKFEELVTGLYEHAHWLDEQRNARVFGREEVTRISPFAKVQALATIYFPAFDESLRELNLAGLGYESWMLGEQKKRVGGAPVAEIGVNFKKEYERYLVVRTKVLEELKAFGRREF